MENKLQKMNPRDITVINADEINDFNSEVTETIRETNRTSDELESLSDRLDQLDVSLRAYNNIKKECRKKMERLSTEL